MKISKLGFLILSLPAVALLFPYSVDAALRVNNSSSVKGKVSIAAQQAAVAQQKNTPQPARTVINESGETVEVTDAEMSACNAVYPNAKFDWVKPTMGMLSGGPAYCSMEVELRSYNDSESGETEYTVLARGYLAAGDMDICNIENFSEVTLAGKRFTYPADAAPTIEEVAAVMAQEQKENAGWKILGAALTGAVGGNMLGNEEKNKGDDSSILGINKDKMKASAIGAVGAAAVMTASTLSNDYKTGKAILSGGMNMAAGAVVGNLSGTGDNVLRIEQCKIGSEQTTCIIGTVDIGSEQVTSDNKTGYFFDVQSSKSYACVYDTTNDNYKDCKLQSLSNIDLDLEGWGSKDACEGMDKSLDIPKKCVEALMKDLQGIQKKYKYDNTVETDSGGTWLKINNAIKMGQIKTAQVKYVPTDETMWDKTFGYTENDWRNTIKAKIAAEELGDTAVVYDLQGAVLKDGDNSVKVDRFKPKTQAADDGDTIDFGNKARAKSTLVGGIGGGALGALSGATGADQEIMERWQASMTAYEASLTNLLCVSGDRWLGKYNEVMEVPDMKTSD